METAVGAVHSEVRVRRPKSLKHSVFDGFASTLITLLRLNRPSRIYQALMSRIDVTKDIQSHGTSMRFDANKQLHLWRALTFNHKEPDTIAWIDGFAKGEVLLDVGANVGVFSIFAAAHRGATVYAFEPESQNYACLNKNIFLNGLSQQVHAFNIGLDSETGLSNIHLGSFESGAANHSVGRPINAVGETFAAAFTQSVIAYAFDDFRRQFALPIPHHIKIDVDGNEERVLKGMAATLADPTVQSVCIEFREGDKALIDWILAKGFSVEKTTRWNAIDVAGQTDHLANFIFRRRT